MKGISKVRVGYAEYKVLDMTPEEVDETSANGLINLKTCSIKIDVSQDYQKQIETLWHEVKHAIHTAVDLGDDSKEEDFCTRGAPMELTVLRDNPDLLRLICLLSSGEAVITCGE